VNGELSQDAAEFGRVALRALESAGGDQLVQQAEREPDRRQTLVEPVLAELGAWDLAPRADRVELEAAAALCRSCGFWAVPYPVAERLCRPTEGAFDGQVVVGATSSPAAPLAGLTLRWLAVTLEGVRSMASPLPVATPRTSAFVSTLHLEALDDNGEGDVALGLVLPCWTLLGMLDRAMDLTRAHVLGREQFGQSLASFQGVQFQLTDAEVERAGLEELAKYALWSTWARPDDALVDALGLRLAAIEAAQTVFRIAHQLHGAMGFCDETPLSWLSRYSQPLRRLPYGLSETSDALTRRIGRRGLHGIFDPPGLSGAPPGRVAERPSSRRAS
jgi:3-oxo-4-pregnene-20-carboxyl-CoA dehydrogenase alpha subunit